MKTRADRDITVGGTTLAGEAIKAGLVDECHLVISPVVAGGGKRALPGHVRVPLELLDKHCFGNGSGPPALPGRDLKDRRCRRRLRRPG